MTEETPYTPFTPRKKLSRYQKPDHLTLEDWQVNLRREYGRTQQFSIKNIGNHPIFSEFQVTNPDSGNTYRVAIRGLGLGENYCSCPDFATNHLGTCKHIEWTLSHLEKQPGGKQALHEGFQPPYSEVFLQYGAQRVVRFQPGTECPFELVEESTEYFDDRGILRRKAFGKVEEFLEKGYQSEHEFRCYADTLGFIAEVRDEQRRQDRLEGEFPQGIHSLEMESLLKIPLYPFQREGALFAVQAGRCLIGDEMGLGKTVQAIAASVIMSRLFGVGRVLIICPTSLKHQWQREIARFTDLPATVIHGTQAQRAEQYLSDAFFKITNYDVIHRDHDFIEELAPELVILDEAQRIKNWETRTAKSVKKINSPYCIVLTGTPLENRLEELVSIVQFIDQHRLGPTYRFLHEHQQRDNTGRVSGYRNLQDVGETLKPILLRRKKSQVLDQLPDRLEKQYFVPMTSQQIKRHNEFRDIVSRLSNKWKRNGGHLSEADRRRLMVNLQSMRMVCDSTWLLDQQTDFSVKPGELITVLEELLEDPETKVVIFSQWVRMLDLVARRMEPKGWDPILFHGSIRSEQRGELIQRFRDDPERRIFLSSDAGGVGLNLQTANVIINLDLPWNPAVLEQRIGRVHRLGQTNRVQVINFISEGTIESGMLSVLAFKQNMFEEVLDGTERDLFLHDTQLDRFMETVQHVTDRIGAGVEVEEEEPETEPVSQPAPSPAPAVQTAPAVPDPLTVFLQQGLALLEQLGAVTSNSDSNSLSWVKACEDQQTGEKYLRIPMPDPALLQQTVDALKNVLQNRPS